MAKTLKMLKLITIFSYLTFLFLTLHSQRAISFELDEENEEDEEYVLDSISNILNNATNTRRSRFLITSSIKTIKKGAQCQAYYKNPCNGVSANKGKNLLFCCKKHCRDVRGDRNNCGQCGRKCNWNERCCGGVCVNVFFNRNNCGKCDRKCKNGVKCSYGYCGYA